eukprot:982799_1
MSEFGPENDHDAILQRIIQGLLRKSCMIGIMPNEVIKLIVAFYLQAIITAKVVLLGDIGVGKTSILSRYLDDSFSLETPNISFEDSYDTVINFGHVSMALTIWDTCGLERGSNPLPRSYYRNANAAILVFDTTDHRSFQNLNHWIEEVRTFTTKDVVIMIAANKTDLHSKREALHSFQHQQRLEQAYISFFWM